MPRYPESEPQPQITEQQQSVQQEPKQELPSKTNYTAPKGESSADLLARVYPVKSYLTHKNHTA